jgi:hypothetical protein
MRAHIILDPNEFATLVAVLAFHRSSFFTGCDQLSRKRRYPARMLAALSGEFRCYGRFVWKRIGASVLLCFTALNGGIQMLPERPAAARVFLDECAR